MIYNDIVLNYLNNCLYVESIFINDIRNYFKEIS